MDRWKTLQSLNIKISKLIYNLINFNKLFLYQDKFIFFEDYLVVQWLNFELKSSIWRNYYISLELKLQGTINLFEPDFMSFDGRLCWIPIIQFEFNKTILTDTIFLFNGDCKCHILFIWYILIWPISYGAYLMPYIWYILIGLGKVIMKSLAMLHWELRGSFWVHIWAFRLNNFTR